MPVNPGATLTSRKRAISCGVRASAPSSDGRELLADNPTRGEAANSCSTSSPGVQARRADFESSTTSG